MPADDLLQPDQAVSITLHPEWIYQPDSGHILNEKYNLKNASSPVLDLFGDGGNAKDAQHASSRVELVSDNYTQVLISGANHRFTEHEQEQEMLQAVTSWINAH
ncbi:MAG: hypothetical protein OEY29_11275 [Gammaproteobacteria bacterium]|nr:hypothetical protein [Gammaproteobacteria bacterium]